MDVAIDQGVRDGSRIKRWSDGSGSDGLIRRINRRSDGSGSNERSNGSGSNERSDGSGSNERSDGSGSNERSDGCYKRWISCEQAMNQDDGSESKL